MIKKLWVLGGQQRWRTLLQVLCQWASEMMMVTILWLGASYLTTNQWSTGIIGLVIVQVIIMLFYGIWGAKLFSDR